MHNLGGGWKDPKDSVQFSCSVVSDSLQPHESQHTRPPCPSPTPGVHSDSRPWSQWCHPAISSSVVPFSSCPQSLPASESFPMSQLFIWGGQSTRVSALASFLPKKSQGWSPSEWTGWISLQSKGQKINVFQTCKRNDVQPRNQQKSLFLKVWQRPGPGEHTTSLCSGGSVCAHRGLSINNGSFVPCSLVSTLDSFFSRGWWDLILFSFYNHQRFYLFCINSFNNH